MIYKILTTRSILFRKFVFIQTIKLLPIINLKSNNNTTFVFLHYKRAITLEQGCQNQTEAAFYHKKQVTKSYYKI